MTRLRLSTFEQYCVYLIAGATNLSCLPALVRVYKTQHPFIGFMGAFTMIISMCYHISEARTNHRQKLFGMKEGDWHKLDNIGSIQCFNGLFIYLANIKNQKLRQYIELFGFGLTLILQQYNPWDIKFTLIPILIHFTIFCINHTLNYFSSKDLYYYRYISTDSVKKGFILFLLGILCFIKGLDDKNDYLRMFHGLWHLFMGLSSYYLWNIWYNKKGFKLEHKYIV